jgi:uncharacterized protein (UPF0332 family)
MECSTPRLLFWRPGSSSTKHSGVISLFNRELVKTGVFPRELARELDAAFEVRTMGDYKDFVVLDRTEVQISMKQAEAFITKTEELIRELDATKENA